MWMGEAGKGLDSRLSGFLLPAGRSKGIGGICFLADGKKVQMNGDGDECTGDEGEERDVSSGGWFAEATAADGQGNDRQDGGGQAPIIMTDLD